MAKYHSDVVYARAELSRGLLYVFQRLPAIADRLIFRNE